MSHAPGPWRVDGSYHVIDANGEDVVVGVVPISADDRYCDQKINANGRLVVAAPDLLEAATMAQDCLRDEIGRTHDEEDDCPMCKAYWKLERALMKARGEEYT